MQTLSVQAPAGATVLVSCSGRGCPARRQRRLVHAREGNEATIAFPRFTRSLRAGVTLRIEVFEAGEIGKLTQLVVRRGKPPKRSDTCLDPTTRHAIGCPT